MGRQARINQRDYRHYVLAITDSGARVVESGWEYKEDAQDQVNELKEDGIYSRIYTKTGLCRMGIDVNDNTVWGNAYRQKGA